MRLVNHVEVGDGLTDIIVCEHKLAVGADCDQVLRDRFGSTHRMEFYSTEALYDIVIRSSRILNVTATPEGAHEMARRARGMGSGIRRIGP